MPQARTLTRLWFLGDVFAIPAGWPLANVFSVGDVLILLGAAVASFRVSGTRWSSPWTPPTAPAAPRRRRHWWEEATAAPIVPSSGGAPNRG
jgi:hypothetical protein